MTKRRAKNTNDGFISPQPKRSLRSNQRKGPQDNISPSGAISNQPVHEQLVTKDNQIVVAPAVSPLNNSQPPLQECADTTHQQESSIRKEGSEQIISTQEKGDPVEKDNTLRRFSQENHTNKSASQDVQGGEEDRTTNKQTTTLDQGPNKDKDGCNQPVWEDQVHGERTMVPEMEGGENSSPKDSRGEEGVTSEQAVVLPVQSDEAVVRAPVRKRRRRMGMCGLGERKGSRSKGERHEAESLSPDTESLVTEEEDTGQSGDDGAADPMVERGPASLLLASPPAPCIPCAPSIIKKCEGEVQLSGDHEIRREAQEQLQDSITAKEQSCDAPPVDGLKPKPSMEVPGGSGDRTYQTDLTTEGHPGQGIEPLPGLQMVVHNQPDPQEVRIKKLEKKKDEIHEKDEFTEQHHLSKTAHIREPDSTKEHQEVQSSTPKTEGDAVTEAKADGRLETEVCRIEAEAEAEAEAVSSMSVVQLTPLEAGTETSTFLETLRVTGPERYQASGEVSILMNNPLLSTDPNAEKESIEELFVAAATPRGSEEIDSAAGATEHYDTRDGPDSFAPGSLDYVSDSQLNDIDLIEENAREQDDVSCLEDVSELVCGLIRELSALNRTVMATHRVMENVRRGSKV